MPKYHSKCAFFRIVLTIFGSQNVSHTGMWVYVLFQVVFPQNDWYSSKKVVGERCCGETATNIFEPAAKKIIPVIISSAAQNTPQHFFRLWRNVLRSSYCVLLSCLILRHLKGYLLGTRFSERCIQRTRLSTKHRDNSDNCTVIRSSCGKLRHIESK